MCTGATRIGGIEANDECCVDNSSDVIKILVKNVVGDANTLLSPTFLNIFSKSFSLYSDPMMNESDVSLFMDLDADIFKETGKKQTRISRCEGESGLMSRIMYDIRHNNKYVPDETPHFEMSSGVKLDGKEMSSVANPLIRA